MENHTLEKAIVAKIEQINFRNTIMIHNYYFLYNFIVDL